MAPVMRAIGNTIGARSATQPASIKVWDPMVRIFHWSLATLFVTAFATGDDGGQLHIAAGYAIAALVALRIVWGFTGPRHARFGSFVQPPGTVLAYLRNIAQFRPRRYLGHNPAGGVMIIALLMSLAGTAITGYMMTTEAFWGLKWIEELHETCASFTVGLVVFHVLGVILSSFLHGENLVMAMITGRKRRS
jgi:cytochrome b